MSEIPLKIVPDEIPAPDGETAVRFSSGTGYLPGGMQFQFAGGSVTFTLKPGDFIIPAKVAQEVVAQMDELARQGVQAADIFGNSIRDGLFPGPAQPADEDAAG